MCYPHLTSYLQTGAEKQERTRTEAPLSCHREHLSFARKGLRWEADGKELEQIWHQTILMNGLFIWERQREKVHTGSSTFCTMWPQKNTVDGNLLRAGIKILQMICRGGIPFQAMIFCAICH